MLRRLLNSKCVFFLRERKTEMTSTHILFMSPTHDIKAAQILIKKVHHYYLIRIKRFQFLFNHLVQ